MVEVVEDLDVPADFLWKTISDFEHIDRWTALKIRAIDGHGVGCKRTVEMENGIQATEQLLTLDAKRMVFSYAIVAPNPYPMQDYRSIVTLEILSEQRSRIRWVGSYLPLDDIDPARTDHLLQKAYSGGIALLRQHYLRQLNQ